VYEDVFGYNSGAAGFYITGGDSNGSLVGELGSYVSGSLVMRGGGMSFTSSKVSLVAPDMYECKMLFENNSELTVTPRASARGDIRNSPGNGVDLICSQSPSFEGLDIVNSTGSGLSVVRGATAVVGDVGGTGNGEWGFHVDTGGTLLISGSNTVTGSSGDARIESTTLTQAEIATGLSEPPSYIGPA
jgi:hypothetical protein